MDRDNTWSWLGFFLGPVYFFICGAGFWGIIILLIHYLIIFVSIIITRTQILYFPINLIISIFCGLRANNIIQKPMSEKHYKFIEKYRQKGYKGRELVAIVRKKEMGLFRILLGFALAIFIYWFFKMVIMFLTGLFIVNFQG